MGCGIPFYKRINVELHVVGEEYSHEKMEQIVFDVINNSNSCIII